MLPKEQIEKIKNELDNCKNPLYFFHDDPDGLSSFLLLYKCKKEGHGVIVKTVPRLDEKFIAKVHEYMPDKIFILDIALVEQEFIDKAKIKSIWIDHHEPLERYNISYFNPRITNKNDNSPVTLICHQVTQDDLWITMTGCIGDWFLPPFYEEFRKKYPDLINHETDPGKILFSTKIGELAKIFSFVLKGKTSDVNKYIKIMTRIENPYEILNQETAQGKFIYKRYEYINKFYTQLLDEAQKQASGEDFLIYIYSDNKMSFTGDLSNELLYKFPDKLIIVGREKSGEIRMSLRAKKLLPLILAKALQGLDGYGGGHEYACGANIKKKDFNIFLSRLKEEYNKLK